MIEEGPEEGRYPVGRSWYANHLHGDQQHVALLALRLHSRKPYTDSCDLMEIRTLPREELGLKRVPHWTMLQEFAKRADTRWLKRLLLGFLIEMRLKMLHLAANSTGFRSTSASICYTRVLEARKGTLGDTVGVSWRVVS
jgi:hypothetical protein